MKPENDKQFETDGDERLAHDLEALFEPKGMVPPHVDRAVMDLVARRLSARPEHRRFVHWYTWAAAAAAVVVVAFLVRDITSPPQTVSRMDINADGVVDVIDALKLAKAVDASATQSQWDINADGAVDDRDVDLVAAAVVRLESEVL